MEISAEPTEFCDVLVLCIHDINCCSRAEVQAKSPDEQGTLNFV